MNHRRLVGIDLGIASAHTVRVLDGAGAPVTDALVETWQADPDGRFAHPDDPRRGGEAAGFRGFGRCPTDAAGRYCVMTLRPGLLPSAGGGWPLRL